MIKRIQKVWYKNVLKTEPLPTGNGVSRQLLSGFRVRKVMA